MFACAKLARTPALVRNPALGPANTLRDRLSFTLATMSSPPSLPPNPGARQTVPRHASPEAYLSGPLGVGHSLLAPWAHPSPTSRSLRSWGRREGRGAGKLEEDGAAEA